jgi:hypothetical protein
MYFVYKNYADSRRAFVKEFNDLYEANKFAKALTKRLGSLSDLRTIISIENPPMVNVVEAYKATADGIEEVFGFVKS